MFKYSIVIVGRSENGRTDCDGIGDSVRAGEGGTDVPWIAQGHHVL